MNSLLDKLELRVDGHDFSEIHPDIVALVAVLAFYPALPKSECNVHFDFPVSDIVLGAFSKPHILPNVYFSGSGKTDRYVPSRDSVISYGGGIDSLAAHLMFPETMLVHETPLSGPSVKYYDVVNDLMAGMSASHQVVHTNLRSLFSVWGLPLWVSVYISSLLFQPKHIVSGSELTGTYLLGGKRFASRAKNRWYDVFSDFGVKVLPTSFLSEYGNAMVVNHHGMMDYAAYCARIGVKDCGRCSKCLRRRLLRAAVNPLDREKLDSFVMSEQMESFLKERPLYYGDIFIHSARSMLGGSLVDPYINDLLNTQSDLSFHQHYYRGAFDDFGYPEAVREYLESKLAESGLSPMSDSHVTAMKSYVQGACIQ